MATKYDMSIERAGLAIAAGGALCGVLAMILLVVGGNANGASAVRAMILGSIIGALAITALGGPVWLALHAAGRRGPAAAGLAGAGVGFVLFLFGQWGVAHAAASPLVAWLRVIGSSLVLAACAGAIAVAMWRIAYRREE